MNRSKETLLLVLLATSIAFVSCDDDNDTPAIAEGTEVTVRNSYQEEIVNALSEGSTVTVRNIYTGQTDNGAVDSTEFALLLGLDSGGLDKTGTISESTVEVEDILEFAGFSINGLYDIDFTETSITFSEVGSEAEQNFWSDSYRVIEAGTKDEYVILFDAPHNITAGSTTTAGVTFQIISATEINVEIGEGFNLQPGVEFTIDLTGTGNPEITWPALFGLADDALDVTAAVSNSTVEFEDVLAFDATAIFGFPIIGLYDIDVTESTISFEVVAGSDPFWSSNYRTIEAGTYDRYYLYFDQPHTITGFEASVSGVNLRIDSDTQVVVELSEGYVFNESTAFTINLNN